MAKWGAAADCTDGLQGVSGLVLRRVLIITELLLSKGSLSQKLIGRHLVHAAARPLRQHSPFRSRGKRTTSENEKRQLGIQRNIHISCLGYLLCICQPGTSNSPI